MLMFNSCSYYNYIVAVAGFEHPNYSINETGGSQEVCVLVFNPPQNYPLVTNILLLASTSTQDSTAGTRVCCARLY